MTKNYHEYEFGTLQQRLSHICALFEIEAPKSLSTDEPELLSDEVMYWVKEHHINVDWLFAGSPCDMLKTFVRNRVGEQKMLEANRQLEPAVQRGFLALLRAVVIYDLPMVEAKAQFDIVIAEYRSEVAGELVEGLERGEMVAIKSS